METCDKFITGKVFKSRIMNLGPCLSPISIALQKFHKPVAKPQIENGQQYVNPMCTSKPVRSPPVSRRSKLKRRREIQEYGIIEDTQLPMTKKQKIEDTRRYTDYIGIGKPVYVRFSALEPPVTLRAFISLIENFGMLVNIKETSEMAPDIHMWSKHWAKWRGDLLHGEPLLDIIHQAQ